MQIAHLMRIIYNFGLVSTVSEMQLCLNQCMHVTSMLKLLGKLPKNYDPKVTPDPERWLPMRERSYYRGRKKGKKKDQIGKGTQGATTAASLEL